MEPSKDKADKLRKGLMNNYRSGIPLPELIYKDIIFFLKSLYYFFLNGFRVKTLHCYPEFPSRNATVYKIATSLKFTITNKKHRRHHLSICWEDTTLRQPDEYLNRLASKEEVINLEANDIRKQLVEDAHQQVFGYSTKIDPSTFTGYCVKKSNLNAAHDGEIVQGPFTETNDETIYQRLINNVTDDQYAEDMRVPIIGNEIPHIYLKYKPLNMRFANFRETNNDKPTQIKAPRDVMSETEIGNILKLARQMNIDFGEMDVLRDREDQRIYVVDVNNTPTGPSHLQRKALRKAIRNLSKAFSEQFLMGNYKK